MAQIIAQGTEHLGDKLCEEVMIPWGMEDPLDPFGSVVLWLKLWQSSVSLAGDIYGPFLYGHVFFVFKRKVIDGNGPKKLPDGNPAPQGI